MNFTDEEMLKMRETGERENPRLEAFMEGMTLRQRTNYRVLHAGMVAIEACLNDDSKVALATAVVIATTSVAMTTLPGEES